MAFRRICGATGMLVLVLVGVLASLTLADDGANRILYPDNNTLTFHYKDTIEVAYDTDYSTPWLYLFCRAGDARQEIVFYSPTEVKSGKQRRLPVQLLSNTEYTGNPCWFNLVPRQRQSLSEDLGVESVEFGYVKQETDAQTYSLSPTSSQATSAATSAAASTSAPPTATSTAAPIANSGLSTGAKAGVGIAAALGGLAVLACALWLFRRRRRDMRASQGGSGGGGAGDESGTNLSPFSPLPEPPRKDMPPYDCHELPQGPQYYELKGGGVAKADDVSPFTPVGEPQLQQKHMPGYHELAQDRQYYELDASHARS